MAVELLEVVGGNGSGLNETIELEDELVLAVQVTVADHRP